MPIPPSLSCLASHSDLAWWRLWCISVQGAKASAPTHTSLYPYTPQGHAAGPQQLHALRLELRRLCRALEGEGGALARGDDGRHGVEVAGGGLQVPGGWEGYLFTCVCMC
jgi:hypothetical protein